MQERVKLKAQVAKPKTKVTLELDAALVAAAAAKGLDLAAALEGALSTVMRSSDARALDDADRAAIEAHNRYIAEHGTLADSFRKL